MGYTDHLSIENDHVTAFDYDKWLFIIPEFLDLDF